MISGYHDQLDMQKGFTYLIGASQEASPNYSWREVNHDMFINQGFPDTWIEWQAITASAKPFEILFCQLSINLVYIYFGYNNGKSILRKKILRKKLSKRLSQNTLMI